MTLSHYLKEPLAKNCLALTFSFPMADSKSIKLYDLFNYSTLEYEHAKKH